MHANRCVYKLTLPTVDTRAFLDACEASSWRALDTGERILTEDGPDGEAVLLVEPMGLAKLQQAALLAQ